MRRTKFSLLKGPSSDDSLVTKQRISNWITCNFSQQEIHSFNIILSLFIKVFQNTQHQTIFYQFYSIKMIKCTLLLTLIISLMIALIYQLTVQLSARSIDKLCCTAYSVLTQLSLSRRREHEHLEFIQNQSYVDSVREKAVNPGHKLNGRLKLSRQDENLEVKEGVLVPIEMAFT